MLTDATNSGCNGWVHGVVAGEYAPGDRRATNVPQECGKRRQDAATNDRGRDLEPSLTCETRYS